MTCWVGARRGSHDQHTAWMLAAERSVGSVLKTLQAPVVVASQRMDDPGWRLIRGPSELLRVDG